LVKQRYFVGMTNAEAAQVLGIPEGVAKHYWIHARTWLYHEITASRTQVSSRNKLIPRRFYLCSSAFSSFLAGALPRAFGPALRTAVLRQSGWPRSHP
jgi:hypothetical protein